MTKEPIYKEIKLVQSTAFGFQKEINNLLNDGWELHGEPNMMEMVYYPSEGEVLRCSQKDLIITQVLKKNTE